MPSTVHAQIPPSTSSAASPRLPTLQDALRACDRALLARIVLSDAVASSPAEVQGACFLEAPVRQIEGALAALCSEQLPARPPAAALLPERAFRCDPRSEALLVRMRAVRVPLSRLGQAKEVRRACPAAALTFRQAQRGRRRARLRGCLNALEPPSFVLEPWKSVLASCLCIDSRLSCRDRYGFLAAAVWELTWCGYTSADARRRSAELRAAADKGCSLLEGGDPGGPSRPSAPPGAQGEWARACAEGLERVATVLNHNAHLARCDRQISWAKRMGVL